MKTNLITFTSPLQNEIILLIITILITLLIILFIISFAISMRRREREAIDRYVDNMPKKPLKEKRAKKAYSFQPIKQKKPYVVKDISQPKPTKKRPINPSDLVEVHYIDNHK